LRTFLLYRSDQWRNQKMKDMNKWWTDFRNRKSIVEEKLKAEAKAKLEAVAKFEADAKARLDAEASIAKARLDLTKQALAAKNCTSEEAAQLKSEAQLLKSELAANVKEMTANINS